MTKRRSWPSHISLPFAVALVYLVVLVYARLDPNLVNATVVNGMLSALTPISIIWGTILLSQMMRRSGAERIIGEWLREVSPHPVAQLMIVGWAFSFMVEGFSGFGTPAAIAAPLLAGLGFDPVRVAILTLVMNSDPVQPLDFGDGEGLLAGSFGGGAHRLDVSAGLHERLADGIRAVLQGESRTGAVVAGKSADPERDSRQIQTLFFEANG